VSLISAGDLPFAAPTGTRLTFLACPPDVAARAFVTAQTGQGHACHLLDGPSEDVTSSLALLRPLSFLGQRHLVFPTASPGWTAYVNNTDSVCFVDRSEHHRSANSTPGTRFSPARIRSG